MTMQQYCLRWNNHQPNFISVFSSLLNNESLVDVTLAAEGKHLQAHKVVLSACSTYFQTLFTINPCQHPIVILKDVKFLDLKVMVDFMYYGEVNVSQEQLPHILKTAEMLKIKGLAEIPVDQSTLTKSHNSSADRTELCGGDSNWSTDDIQRHSLSPSPSPLSPASKRKRLRKASTGSGSGSTERISEEQTPSEVTVTSPGGSVVGTVIKPDPGGFSNECSTPLLTKQYSNETELHRGSSHESNGDHPHQITLQVPQQDTLSTVDTIPSSIDLGSSPITQQTSTGYQWSVMDGTYTRYALSACHSNVTVPNEVTYTPLQQCSTINSATTSTNDTAMATITHDISTSLTQQNLQKRKRSINPQADENFVRALEAVRYGGIGFCKAAKMYGVNNRTLWLEYKKRGYPNNRLSIKNRKQEFISPCSMSDNPTSPIDIGDTNIEQKTDDHIVCTETEATTSHSNTNATIVSTAYFDNRHIDLAPLLQRPRYLDVGVGLSQQHAVGLAGVTFEQM